MDGGIHERRHLSGGGLSNCGFTNKAYLVKVMMDVIYE